MGFIKKAVKKQQRRATDAAKAKSASTARKATPGLCDKTGGRHQYKSQMVGGHLTRPACKCGKVR